MSDRIPIDYSALREQAPSIEILEDGGVLIVVPTRRSYARIAMSVLSADIFAFIFIPFVWLAFALFSTKKPRAILQLSADEFSIQEWSDDGLGIVARKRYWPLHSVGELRPNRFSAGIYLTIRQKDVQFLLTDVSTIDVTVICDALAEARIRISHRTQLEP